MEPRSFLGRLWRVTFVFTVIGAYYVLGQYISYRLDNGSTLYDVDGGFRYFGMNASLLTTIMSYLAALMVMGVVWLAYQMLLEAYEWAFYRKTYVDPCSDDKCPCQRHVVERKKVRAAAELDAALTASAVGVSAAVATSSVINN
jgi:hypothetical protein